MTSKRGSRFLTENALDQVSSPVLDACVRVQESLGDRFRVHDGMPLARLMMVDRCGTGCSRDPTLVRWYP